MKTNLAQKQQLLDKIQFLSTEQISNVLQFVDSLPNLKNNSEDVTYKPWQPCDPLDAIEKLTLLLETDKLNNFDEIEGFEDFRRVIPVDKMPKLETALV